MEGLKHENSSCRYRKLEISCLRLAFLLRIAFIHGDSIANTSAFLQKEMNLASQETGPPPMVYHDPSMVKDTGTQPQKRVCRPADSYFPWGHHAPRVSLRTRDARLPFGHHHMLPSLRRTILHPGSQLWLPTHPQPLHLSLAQARGPGFGSWVMPDPTLRTLGPLSSAQAAWVMSAPGRGELRAEDERTCQIQTG